MKTLIVLLLSSIDTMLAGRFPIEIFEIRETNDNQLYVKNSMDNEPYRQDSETRLARIVKPYKQSNVDKITKELIAKLKVMRKNKQKNNRFQPEIYVINGDSLDAHNHNFEEYLDQGEAFVDETRNEEYKPAAGQKVLWRVVPQKKFSAYEYIRPRSILRTEDRTSAPIHKHLYEEDD